MRFLAEYGVRIYCELADQYKLLDAASAAAKRHVLAEHLKEVIDTLEQKVRRNQLFPLFFDIWLIYPLGRPDILPIRSTFVPRSSRPFEWDSTEEKSQ